MSISRRNFLQASALAVGGAALAHVSGGLGSAIAATPEGPRAKASVYFTNNLSPEGLRTLYARVSQNMVGRVAVKLHTGEPNGPNIIPQEWVKSFLPHVPNSTIVECNVLYPSPRQTTDGHRKTLETNGWTFSPVDIMDADGDVNLPVSGGKWFKEVAFGKNIVTYDSMLVLTHFKGHTMGGFGGSLKNISIGCASGRAGKEQLHREGAQVWSGGPNFMERMVEGGKAVVDHFGPRIAYINVLRNMSVSCDCEGASAEPVRLPDLGILASTDILAIDKASVDMVYALPENIRAHMVERIESRNGLHQLTHMKTLNMGSDQYDLITL